MPQADVLLGLAPPVKTDSILSQALIVSSVLILVLHVMYTDAFHAKLSTIPAVLPIELIMGETAIVRKQVARLVTHTVVSPAPAVEIAVLEFELLITVVIAIALIPTALPVTTKAALLAVGVTTAAPADVLSTAPILARAPKAVSPAILVGALPVS